MENQKMLRGVEAAQRQSLLELEVLANRAVSKMWNEMNKFGSVVMQSLNTYLHRTVIQKEYIVVVTNEQ